MSEFESQTSSIWQEIESGARKQQAVIMAIVYKDFRSQLGKSRFGIIWVLIEPMVAMIMLSSLWYLVGRVEIDGQHVMLFITSGVLPYLMARNFLSKVPVAFRQNQQLFDYPLVKPIDALMAKVVLETFLLIVAAAILLFLLYWFAGLKAEFPNKLELIGTLIMLVGYGVGLSLLIAVYGQFYESLPRVVNMVTRPLIFVSGVMYSINDLPNAAREILAWNPLVHFIEYVRINALGVKPIPELSLFYIASLSACLLGLGLASYYVNRFRLLQR